MQNTIVKTKKVAKLVSLESILPDELQITIEALVQDYFECNYNKADSVMKVQYGYISIMPKRHNINEVVTEKFMKHYGIDMAFILSRSRKTEEMIVKQELQFVLKVSGLMNLRQLQELFGHRQHGAVLSNYKRILTLIQSNRQYREYIQILICDILDLQPLEDYNIPLTLSMPVKYNPQHSERVRHYIDYIGFTREYKKILAKKSKNVIAE